MSSIELGNDVSITGSAAGDMRLAGTCLRQVREMVDVALGHVKARCSVGGVFKPERLDEQQLVSYELAFCVAELTAAKTINRCAEKTQQVDALSGQVALVFSAEALQSVSQRLLSQVADLGLERQALLSLYAAPEMVRLLDHYLAGVGTGLSGRREFIRE